MLARSLAVVALVGADFALLGWATQLVVTHQKALSTWGIAGCAGSTMLAALCGCAAALVVAGAE